MLTDLNYAHLKTTGGAWEAHAIKGTHLAEIHANKFQTAVTRVHTDEDGVPYGAMNRADAEFVARVHQSWPHIARALESKEPPRDKEIPKPGTAPYTAMIHALVAISRKSKDDISRRIAKDALQAGGERVD